MSFRVKQIYILLGFIVFSFTANAQNSNVHSYTLDSLEMGFEVDMVSASSVNNAMLNASGFIDDDLKDENLMRLGNINQGGNYANAKLFYKSNRANLWGVDRLSYSFAIEWHLLSEYQFTKDLYQLIFYGNKRFEGRIAKIDPSGSYTINYYQIKAGLNRRTKNERHYFGINVGLNLGNKLSGFRFYDTSYFATSLDGREIALQANVDYFESDTAKTNWNNVSGIGAAVDFHYKYMEKGHYILSVSVENLGFISWNNKTVRLKENKEHVFQGVEVDNIFDVPNPLINSDDTLKDYIYANAQSESNYMFTPTDVKLYYEHFLANQKIKIGFLTQIRLFSYMLPLIQFDATYKLNDHIRLGPIVSTGGYTRFNAGLKFEFNFAKNYQIKLESRYITGFAQHSFSGMGGFINFTYKL